MIWPDLGAVLLQPGKTIDRYRVLAPIGEGGMAKVYQVEHIHLGSLHALKVHSSTKLSIKLRFEREGRLQASLDHKNLVRVSDVIDLGERTGLVMDFVNGPSLSHLLRRIRPPLEDSITIFRELASGLGHAHLQGLIHRDLKPSNVLLHLDGDRVVPKLTDFGLAKSLIDIGNLRTRTGATLGTPSYMPPEQIRDASKVDHRADLYGLGCLLYTLCCGRPPFRGSDVVDLLERVEAGQYPDPLILCPTLPTETALLIADLLRPDPEDRPEDVQEILERLSGHPEASVTELTVAAVRQASVEMARRLRAEGPGDNATTVTLPGHGIRALGVCGSDEGRSRLREAAEQCGLSLIVAESSTVALGALNDAAGSGSPFGILMIDDGPRGGLLAARVGRDSRLSTTRVLRVDQVPPGLDSLIRVLRGLLPENKSAFEQNTDVRLAPSPARRLLVVEDNRVQRTLLCHFLDRYGFEVVAVGDLTSALAAVDSQKFDGMVVDVHLPDGTGLDVLEHLHHAGRQTPAIVLTADSKVSLPEVLDRKTRVEVLGKPFRNWELQASLDRVLDAAVVQDHVLVDSGVLDRLAQLLGGGHGPVRELIDVFLGDVDNEKRAWQSAMEGGDYEQVVSLVRRLQPAAAHLGARALGRACEDLLDGEGDEAAAQQERLQRVVDLLDQTAEALKVHRSRRTAKAS